MRTFTATCPPMKARSSTDRLACARSPGGSAEHKLNFVEDDFRAWPFVIAFDPHQAASQVAGFVPDRGSGPMTRSQQDK